MACDHKKQENVHYCGSCGADLTLIQEEIDARDKFFEIYRDLMNAKHPDVKLTRSMFDAFIKTKGATMAMQILRMFASEGKIEVTEPQADALLKLEREKLDILKEIRDKLPILKDVKGKLSTTNMECEGCIAEHDASIFEDTSQFRHTCNRIGAEKK